VKLTIHPPRALMTCIRTTFTYTTTQRRFSFVQHATRDGCDTSELATELLCIATDPFSTVGPVFLLLFTFYFISVSFHFLSVHYLCPPFLIPFYFWVGFYQCSALGMMEPGSNKFRLVWLLYETNIQRLNMTLTGNIKLRCVV